MPTVEAGREVAVARAVALDNAEQSLRRADPGKPRELVDRRDDHARHPPVDLLVDRHHRQALAVRTHAAELALRIAAVGQDPRLAAVVRRDDDVAAGVNLVAAPGAVRKLVRAFRACRARRGARP